MAGTMALFQTAQKVYKTMGIIPSPAQSNRFCWLNAKIYVRLIIIIQLIIATAAFFLLKANTIQSLADSFYVSLTHVFCLIYILINIWKITDILQLINQYEKFIQKRKFGTFATWFAKCVALNSILIPFSAWNRITEFNFKCRNLRWAERKNRTPDWADVLCCSEVDTDWSDATLFDYHNRQLLQLWLGQWVILSASFGDVRNTYYVFKPFVHSNFRAMITKVWLIYLITFHSRLPYNWKTPIAYLLTLLIECADAYILTSSIVPVLCFFMGSCALLITFVEDITKDLALLDFTKNRTKSSSASVSSKAKEQIKVEIATKHFCNIIERLSDTKQLSTKSQFSEILIIFFKKSNFPTDLSASSTAFMSSSSQISFYGRFSLCAVPVWPCNRNSLSTLIHVSLVCFSSFSIENSSLGLLLRQPLIVWLEKWEKQIKRKRRVSLKYYWQFFFVFSKVGKWIECIWSMPNTVLDILVDRIHFLPLWMWRTGDPSIWDIQLWAW